jgi:sulfate permease, SulP family
VPGVESVPDGLAAVLLAGVNPLAGLYAYLFGTIGGSFCTSSVFMAVQATGAMAVVIADVPAVHAADDPARVTLSVLTGVVMLGAGFPRSLPLPVAPMLRLVPSLLIPAISLAFAGLVQGAGISG